MAWNPEIYGQYFHFSAFMALLEPASPKVSEIILICNERSVYLSVWDIDIKENFVLGIFSVVS